MPAKFDIIKRFFPIEDIMLAPEEVNDAEYAFQAAMSSMGCDQLLGLRTTSRLSSNEATKARLQLMLEAYTGNERQARFDADRVACWASMCNIRYDYQKEDSLQDAVSKVVIALRGSGTRVFNFVPPQMKPLTTKSNDHFFFRFAQRHVMSNATTDTRFDGLPIFTGRSDTMIHLRSVLDQDLGKVKDSYDLGLLLGVQGVVADGAALLSDISHTMQFWREAMYGSQDDSSEILSRDPIRDLQRLLATSSTEVTRSYTMLKFSVPAITSPGKDGGYIKAWALCPNFTSLTQKSLRVARENTNGTLVLIELTDALPVPLAYLVITDQRSGTILLRSDDRGHVDLQLDTPKQSGSGGAFRAGPNLSDMRTLKCQIKLTSVPMRPRAS